MANNTYNAFERFLLVGIACTMLFFYATPYVHADLSSEGYTISAYGFGQQNTTMSSPNFTLSTSDSSQLTQTTSVAPDSAQNEIPRLRGSGKNRLILDTLKASTSTGIGALVTEVVRVDNERAIKDNDSERSDEQQKPQEDIGNFLSSANTVPGDEDVFSNLSASLIGARDAFNAIFAHRSARVVLLIGVLLGLFVIRTYTTFGRTYRPF